jgi:hypothetical protein
LRAIAWQVESYWGQIVNIPAESDEESDPIKRMNTPAARRGIEQQQPKANAASGGEYDPKRFKRLPHSHAAKGHRPEGAAGTVRYLLIVDPEGGAQEVRRFSTRQDASSKNSSHIPVGSFELDLKCFLWLLSLRQRK